MGELIAINGGKAPVKSSKLAGTVIFLGRSMVVLVRPLSGEDEWLLPKGHVNDNETISEAAEREALEEAGAVVSFTNPVAPIPFLTSTHKTEDEKQEISWFAVTCAALKTELRKENREIGIFPILVAMARLTYQDQRDVLCTAISGTDAQ